MPSRTCPTCRRTIEGSGERCPHDGTPLPPPSPGQSALASSYGVLRASDVTPPVSGRAPASASKVPAAAPTAGKSAIAQTQPQGAPSPPGASPPRPVSRGAAVPPRPAPSGAPVSSRSGPASSRPVPASTPAPMSPRPAASSPGVARGVAGVRGPGLVRPAAGRPAYDSAPEVQLDTMSPESMERAGLVLPEHADVFFHGATALEGQLLAGKYRVQRRLGEGGMGEVYLAEHEAIGKRVALKVLRSDQAQKAEVVERFRIEARSASRIQHPSVVQVFDFGELDDGRFYLALEYLEGSDLAQELHRTRTIEPMRALHITLQVCGGLGAAHERGVVHRDLKPENVFLQRNRLGLDDVKIVDFGIAKMRELSGRATYPDLDSTGERERRLTQAGSIFGTPEYMAPEQAAGGEIDHHADIYAVGILLYEMVSGRVPFTSDNLLKTLTQQVSEPPTPPRQLTPPAPISAQLESVILQTLAKNPLARPDSMEVLAEQLQDTPEGARLLDALRGVSPLAIPGVPSPRRSGLATESSSTQSLWEELSSSGPRPQAPPVSHDDDEVIELARGSQAPLPLVTPARSSATLDRLPQLDLSSTAETPSARSTSAMSLTPVSTPPPRRGLVMAAGALTIGAALGGWLLFGRTTPRPEIKAITPVAPSTTTSEPAPPSTPSVAPAVSVPSVAAAASTAPTPAGAGVTLHVVTYPEGAMVQKGDFQVCDRAPCDVVVQPNEAVELVATLGNTRGVAKVLAQRQQTVQIRLQRVATPAGRPTAAPAPSAPSAPRGASLCEYTEGDLKILRPCK